VKMRDYRNGLVMAAATFALVALASAPAHAQAAAAQGGAAAKPAYTMPEYNAFTACQTEKDPNQQVKCFDDFVSRFPSSSLMQYVYQLEIPAYANLKNCQKEVDAADKLIALDSVDVGTRAQAAIQRLQAFAACYDPKSPDAQAQLTKDRDLATQALKLLSQIQPKAGMTPEAMAAALKPAVDIVDDQGGWADLQLKDFPSAVSAYKDAITAKPDDAAASYELGTAYLAMTPPQAVPGFWAIARAIDLKVPTADKVQDYLHSRILAYEQPGCDSQVDDQLKEMLTLAQTSPDPPATYTIPSADDLSKIRGSSTILTIVGDLSAGGDKAKLTWLATCGSELSAVTGKIVDVQTGDSTVDFMVYTGATSEDMQAATTANMDVKVYTATPATPPAAPATSGGTAPAPITPQPDVARLAKDDPITFSGTITSYDPTPFLLHWQDVKVDPSVIPAEKSAPGRGRKPAAK
jgi:tetratricopeptide (TPR) repeat protein